ncbi:MupA/Atu3671 family FMN-dependent luciferase-like monooxygenase [Paenibacillus thiaminolyticus]|uniref:MupA/Atu3671 family FMN-dependent luciferase-like monooxygenase n=1 Tax=Paenibacillus thiaminolyticus TaxID=49283 RepID=UPI0035A6357E
MEKNLKDRYAALTQKQRALVEKQLELRGKKLERIQAGREKTEANAMPQVPRRTRRETSRMDFSLFFFSGDGTVRTSNKYELLLDSVRYADQNGFKAVWTPERHFQDFGGLYPNPSVMSAALAMITKSITIRSGSVAVPLHHPIRIAEEWAMVDNLSNGRVEISCASGWHPNDFILSSTPTQENHSNRREVMFDHIATVQQLWRGESVSFTGIDGQTVELRSLPRPVQSRLPIWISSQGSPETFGLAGAIGANVLTALVGQTLEEVGKKIAAYRESLATHGYDPQAGKVAVMVHTFLGADDADVKELVREPLSQYLHTFIAQQDKSDDTSYGKLTERDKEELIRIAFENYYNTIALLGTPARCEHLIEELVDIGVNEVACLIDFGLPADTVLGGLEYLNQLRETYAQPATAGSLEEVHS